VISYIKRLREVCDKIIFIADNEAKQEEQNKLTGLVDFKQFQRHGEYDFGSYKRGWQYLKNQEWFSQIDELILCNDSCFSIGALTPVFEQMSHKQCDFWGMTESKGYQSHLQSFFLVFKQPVLQSQVFDEFLCSFKHEENFLDIVLKYEIPLKGVLENHGFRAAALISGIKSPHQHPLKTMKLGMPLVKKKNFIPPVQSLDGTSLEGIGRLLFRLKRKSVQDYMEILDYLQISPLRMAICFFLRTRYFFFKRFLYHKKITKEGRFVVKICKIPVIYKKIRTNT
jgi:lipopolysaccharide biosynthesis protein